MARIGRIVVLWAALPAAFIGAFLVVFFGPGQPVRADAAACKAVLDSVIKQASVPVHQKITIENAAAPGRKIDSELIRTGDTLYMQIRGQWTKRPYDPAKAAEDARTAMQKAEHDCTRTGSESVGGQAADVYAVHSHGPEGDSQSKVWISSSSGLPLRQHTEMTAQGHKMQHEATYDYANVKAPIQ
jgi:hypothetical protein